MFKERLNYSDLVYLLPIGILIMDTGGRVKFLNDEGSKILNLNSKETLDKK